jgi:NAD(P)-dependent dehydrogenase (short-subunit alcohol dehydrogenase family)
MDFILRFLFYDCEAFAMKTICVITGGGSGMGLAAAKLLGQRHRVLIAGRRAAKLESALGELEQAGVEAEALACDVADRASVQNLAGQAAAKGPVAVVIHGAGMSPHMGDWETILQVNALGTVHVNSAFYGVLEAGGCLIDIASMSGYLFTPVPSDWETYALSRTDTGLFMEKMTARVNAFPESHRGGVAYSMSKHFVTWYARGDAGKFGEKGVRVLSVSPGLFDTPMGDAERESAATILPRCALKRMGRPEEIAALLAFCAGPGAGYLTGADILCDGGYVASRQSL